MSIHSAAIWLTTRSPTDHYEQEGTAKPCKDFVGLMWRLYLLKIIYFQDVPTQDAVWSACFSTRNTRTPVDCMNSIEYQKMNPRRQDLDDERIFQVKSCRTAATCRASLKTTCHPILTTETVTSQDRGLYFYAEAPFHLQSIVSQCHTVHLENTSERR